ncbi:MAG: hypothetical protein PHR06_15835, partial [Candidatus Cloacimonetes bacterium]|nr:hypothetical protein [Candidatus Cloacimonadota bacterium]
AVNGKISGSLAAESFIFFESAKYKNYVAKGSVSIFELESNFFLPLFFKKNTGYGFIDYEKL